MMTVSQIRESIAPELRELNDRMTLTLDSSNELMNQVIYNYMQSKGKQLRPMLVILTAKIFGEVTSDVIAAAAAVELLHNASLIHDDVVDDSDTRHGRKTINAVWDNHIAVLVGDFFVSGALREAIRTRDLRVIDTVGQLGQMLSVGEMDQICNARFHSIDEENYYKVISHKTASLFVSCVKMGCYTVGASDADVEVMSEYAELFGRCFQLRDDIYDYFSSEEIGKPTGNDLREGKLTLPLLYALSVTDDPRHEDMLALSRKEMLETAEIETLISYAKELGGIEYAFAAIRSLSERACALLDRLPQCEATEALRSLVLSLNQ
ncbi:MAG: polyprenyl synthetase family protein [Duncaniella sp.]|nr:polyprenyl synthetase family protein [Duncaniella sp.]